MDFKKGISVSENGDISDITLPKANVIKYDLGNDEWVCVRPSGTEPKLKVYVSTAMPTLELSKEKNERLFEEFKF